MGLIVAEEKKKYKLTKSDVIWIIIAVLFIALIAIPRYLPREYDVARPNYTGASAKDVMIENCVYWGKYQCDSTKDVSLPQVEWYINDLCGVAGQQSSLNCANLKQACNQITGNQTCPGV